MHRVSALVAALSIITINGCSKVDNSHQRKPGAIKLPNTQVSPVVGSQQTTTVANSSLPAGTAHQRLLEESWDIYRKQFIQEDGRVIDFEASDRSISEGQAYAMLRAVIINDPTTFELTLQWAEENLKREINGKRSDNLWAWKWGRNPDGNWGTIDSNFASDADIDAVTALILAARRWNRPDYLELARLKLKDLYALSTATGSGGKRYLLPGPKTAFVTPASTLHLNPSYFAPYAFRLFAQIDPDRNWLSLVESSYQVLDESARISQVDLPSDWIALDTKTGKFAPLPESHPLRTLYSFDAYRVWWRVALDAAWFKSPEAQRYLQRHTKYLRTTWRQKSRIPARIDLQGKALVDYDATSQYAMLYSAMQLIDSQLADQMLQTKLLPRYKQGIWDDESAYYTQNLAWLGLVSPEVIPQRLLKPN
ncbi:MAG: glycosyl hydrolase family 8 [Nostocaceae cyanobacterium]|nr:glycosyl hydrolase family 8 [Nostocaceae cyanobacterium]